MGIAPLDFFVSHNRYPHEGEKIDGVSGSHLIAGGGPVPNTLCGFARLGGTASVIAAFGDDQWAQIARSDLDRFGVDHNLSINRKGIPTALAFAWINIKTGDRTIILDRNPRLDLKPSDLKLHHLPKTKLIHLDGRNIPACLKLARWGKQNGAQVMLDVGSVRNRVDDLFPFLDFLVCAEEYACHYHRTKSVKKASAGFRKLGIPEVVVTSGIRGSYGIDSGGDDHFQPAFKVKAVDGTGAGDAYHAGYLWGILKGKSLAEKMKFGSAVAALKCRKPGARAGLPTLRETELFLKRHRVYHA